jgi:hypothetical protein
MTYVLIILVYMGSFSDNDSNTLVAVPGFTDLGICQKAAAAVEKKFSAGQKGAMAMCVQHTPAPDVE